jgi:hypothetical protein
MEFLEAMVAMVPEQYDPHHPRRSIWRSFGNDAYTIELRIAEERLIVCAMKQYDT